MDGGVLWSTLGRAINCIIYGDLIFTLFLDVLIGSDPSVDETFLGQHGLEDFITIVQIKSVQIFRFDFLFSDDFDAIEHAQLRDVVEDLAPIVLLILDWIETKVKLCQQVESFNVLELADLHDIVQRKVQEPERLNLLQASQVLNMIF